ncbi:hypothetical protein SFUMM280S_04852 [Streptomyces fumanus]
MNAGAGQAPGAPQGLQAAGLNAPGQGPDAFGGEPRPPQRGRRKGKGGAGEDRGRRPQLPPRGGPRPELPGGDPAPRVPSWSDGDDRLPAARASLDAPRGHEEPDAPHPRRYPASTTGRVRARRPRSRWSAGTTSGRAPAPPPSSPAPTSTPRPPVPSRRRRCRAGCRAGGRRPVRPRSARDPYAQNGQRREDPYARGDQRHDDRFAPGRPGGRAVRRLLPPGRGPVRAARRPLRAARPGPRRRPGQRAVRSARTLRHRCRAGRPGRHRSVPRPPGLRRRLHRTAHPAGPAGPRRHRPVRTPPGGRRLRRRRLRRRAAASRPSGTRGTSPRPSGPGDGRTPLYDTLETNWFRGERGARGNGPAAAPERPETPADHSPPHLSVPPPRPGAARPTTTSFGRRNASGSRPRAVSPPPACRAGCPVPTWCRARLSSSRTRAVRRSRAPPMTCAAG